MNEWIIWDNHKWPQTISCAVASSQIKEYEASIASAPQSLLIAAGQS